MPGGPFKLAIWFRMLAILLLSIWVGQPFAWSQRAMPFQYTHSLILVEVKLQGSQDKWVFLLSTGTNLSAIDHGLAEALGLAITEGQDSVLGTAGKEPYNRVLIPQLSLGGVDYKDLRFACRELKDLLPGEPFRIHGILGTDFLRQFAIDIDFAKQRLRCRRDPKPLKAKLQLPFELVDGLPQITVLINDTLETALRYNSGSSMERSNRHYLNLSHFQWAELKRKQRFLPPANSMVAKGVGGFLYLQVVRLTSLESGAWKISHPYAIIQGKEGCFADSSSIGFFGNSMLEGYGRITIDFVNQQFTLLSPAF